MVCLRNICINTLHKGDDDDDDNNNNKCMLLDAAISGDRNVIKEKAEKIPKYKDLTIESQRIWNVKAKVIPVIVGATGTISDSFSKYSSNIPGKQEVKERQKIAILGTAHILQKVLIQKYRMLNIGSNITYLLTYSMEHSPH